VTCDTLQISHLRPRLDVLCAALWPAHKAHGVAAVCGRVMSLYGLSEEDVIVRLNAGCMASAGHTSHLTPHTSHPTPHTERPHVIVDLNTWTDGHVISSIASSHLLAPVVVSAIGHPGTSGSYSHTHVLVDAVSAPTDYYISRFILEFVHGIV
jgi:hypothetical protein